MLGLYQNSEAERQGANIIRQLGANDRMMRDANPMRGFIKRALSQNALCAGNGIPYTDPSLAKFGIFWEPASQVSPSGGFPHLFMTSLMAMMLGIEARVGEYAGWQTLLNGMQPLFVGLYDAATGGSSFDFTLYAPSWADANNNVYADWPTMRAANAINDGPHAENAGFRYGSSSDGGIGTISSIPRAAIYMAGHLDTPPTDAVSVAQESYNRYKATYPGQAGVINYFDPSGNFCPQFAIAPPPGVN